MLALGRQSIKNHTKTDRMKINGIEWAMDRSVFIESPNLTDSPRGLITIQWYPSLKARTRLERCLIGSQLDLKHPNPD